ncbi:DUF1080 domain-containing protein [Flavobacteriaceae bacterium M23B6Z8]
MKKIIILCCLLVISTSCHQAQTNQEKQANPEASLPNQTPEKEPTKPEETEVWEPVPEKVTIDKNGAPSDAIILFDGTDLDAWESVKEEGAAAPWIINDDESMTVKNGSGDIRTKENFGSIQLHLEWRNPETPKADGQNRGNSGVFLQELYEVQILDTYNNQTYVNGQAGAIYKQYPPLVNAGKPSGEWQVYDIIFHAPEFDETGKKIKSGTLTVLHNGILIQDHVEILGSTEYIGWPKNDAHGDAPIKLQDHNDNSGVSFRNIWLRKL